MSSLCMPIFEFEIYVIPISEASLRLGREVGWCQRMPILVSGIEEKDEG
jgi:hypothetical protein